VTDQPSGSWLPPWGSIHCNPAACVHTRLSDADTPDRLVDDYLELVRLYLSTNVSFERVSSARRRPDAIQHGSTSRRRPVTARPGICCGAPDAWLASDPSTAQCGSFRCLDCTSCVPTTASEPRRLGRESSRVEPLPTALPRRLAREPASKKPLPIVPDRGRSDTKLIIARSGERRSFQWHAWVTREREPVHERTESLQAYIPVSSSTTRERRMERSDSELPVGCFDLGLGPFWLSDTTAAIFCAFAPGQVPGDRIQKKPQGTT